MDSLANYTASLPSKANKKRSQYIAAAKEVNPNFNEAEYDARKKFLTDWRAGTTSQNIVALNTTLGHLGTLTDSVEELGNTNFKPLNKVKNWLYDVTGNPAIVGNKVTSGAVASEIAKVFKGGASPTEDEIQYWKDTLDSKMSPAQFKEVIKKNAYLLSSRMKSQVNNYKRNMGEYPSGDNSILFPEATNVLQRLGIDPNQFTGVEQKIE